MQNVKCKKHNISLNVKFECWFSIHFTFIYYYKMLQIYELRIDQYIILDFFIKNMYILSSNIGHLYFIKVAKFLFNQSSKLNIDFTQQWNWLAHHEEIFTSFQWSIYFDVD